MLAVVVAGHVDHGKSTLIGRLLHDTGSLPPGKAKELEALSAKRGVPLEWSFLVDSLQTERDQAVTIDTTRVWTKWKGRRYVIIDTPGHREFVRNMLTGASDADAAILVVDVQEGVGEQTRRHAQLLKMLGLQQVVVAVNKMDAAAYDRANFDVVAESCRKLFSSTGLSAKAIVPLSARNGENTLKHSKKMPWYDGPSLIEALAEFKRTDPVRDAPLRIRIQDVYRDGAGRIAVGKIDSGRVRVGDAVVLSPAGAITTVRSIEEWNAPARAIASAGDSVGLTFTDPVFVNRGDLVSHEHARPAIALDLRAICFWLGDASPVTGDSLILHLGPNSVRVVISSIEEATDSSSREALPLNGIQKYAIVRLKLRSATRIALDGDATASAPSRAILTRGGEIVAGGIVEASATNDLYTANHLVTLAEREARYGHRGVVLWLTGLSGSGKSTLAMGLERTLHERGASVYVLDGDNIRRGLSSDLGFSAVDRAENIRRIGEVAALFADAGVIVITAFISPTQRDRELARAACGDCFHEIFLQADLKTCEARDPKGIYKRARAGEISDFTGISAPYEPPVSPQLIVDTAHSSIEQCLAVLAEYAENAASLWTNRRELIQRSAGGT